MIQIEEDSAMELKEHAKKALKHMGKLMECVEELCEESQMGERGGYGNRGIILFKQCLELAKKGFLFISKYFHTQNYNLIKYAPK